MILTEGRTMKGTLTVLAIAAIAILIGGVHPGPAAELQPLMAGWERHFTVDWQAGQHRGKPVVEGYVNNISPYHTTQIRVLVESLDAAGQVTHQQVAWIPGDLLGGGRAFFQVATRPASGYRVRVFSYDRIEAPSTFQ
jgi:hypothetical protein